MLYEIRKHALDLAEKQKLVLSGELIEDPAEEKRRRHRKKKSKHSEITETPASPADVDPNPIDAAELVEQQPASAEKQAKKKRKHEVEEPEEEKPKRSKAEKEARREEKHKHKHKSSAPAPASPKPIVQVTASAESNETTPKRKKTDVELQVPPATDVSTPTKAILKKKASISASEPRRGRPLVDAMHVVDYFIASQPGWVASKIQPVTPVKVRNTLF